MDTSRSRSTQLLKSGDEQGLEPLLYAELRRLASSLMQGERESHTLQPTALVHEAYLRLIDVDRSELGDRERFVGLAVRCMRRILVDHARSRDAQKRKGAGCRVTLSGLGEEQNDLDLLLLEDVLCKLTHLDERKGRIVELRFFGGLSTSEISKVLDVSESTVRQDWYMARAWLNEQLC